MRKQKKICCFNYIYLYCSIVIGCSENERITTPVHDEVLIGDALAGVRSRTAKFKNRVFSKTPRTLEQCRTNLYNQGLSIVP